MPRDEDREERRHGGIGYQLRRPTCERDWGKFHAIQRSVDFEAEGEAETGDDVAAGHHPLLLWWGESAVGSLRIDSLEDGDAAAFRLVAINPEFQGHGHGRALLREAEAFARDIGCRKAVVYSTPDAAGFYETAGYAEDLFDEQYFGGVVQMTKPLHYAGFFAEDNVGQQGDRQ
jgi:GNAT superfamily N-acetyltransferase